MSFRRLSPPLPPLTTAQLGGGMCSNSVYDLDTSTPLMYRVRRARSLDLIVLEQRCGIPLSSTKPHEMQDKSLYKCRQN